MAATRLVLVSARRFGGDVGAAHGLSLVRVDASATMTACGISGVAMNDFSMSVAEVGVPNTIVRPA